MERDAILSLMGEMAVQNFRYESEARIRQPVAVDALQNNLCTYIGVDTALGLPPGPNSDLSVRRKHR